MSGVDPSAPAGPDEWPGSAAPEPRHAVRIEPDGLVLVCASSQSLLAAMERAGIGRHAVGCRGGGCGRCRVHVTEGTVVLGRISRAHVTVEQEQLGYALACRTYPRSDVVLTWAPATPPKRG